MAKGILEFDLNEELNNFKLATNAKDIMLVLWEVDQEFRAKVKYAPDTTSQETVLALMSIRNLLRENMHERGISFDMFE